MGNPACYICAYTCESMSVLVQAGGNNVNKHCSPCHIPL
jgi:hypothetical protein